MDTPKSCKPTATTTAEAVPAQDSPVFSFISNLSPIQPVKPPPVTQGFPGLNSPPLVFTSPRLIPRSKLTSIRRPQFPGLSSAKLSEQNNISSNSPTTVAYESQDVHLPDRVITCDDHAESPEECTDKFLSDVVDLDSVTPNNLADSSRKKSENVGQSQEPITGLNVEYEHIDNARVINEVDVAARSIAKEIKGEHQGNALSNMGEIVTNIEQEGGITLDPHRKIESQLPLDHTLTDQVHDSRTQNQEISQAGLMNQSSKLPLGSVQTGKDDESSVECTDVVLAKSVLKDMQNVEAFQHRGIRRRCLQFEDALQKVISNRPAQDPSDGGCPTLLSREPLLLPSNRKQAETVQPTYPGNINSGKNIPKRSGIGLHLNSIVSSVHAGRDSVVRVKSAQMVSLSIRGKKSIPLTNSPLGDTSNSSPMLYLTENASASTSEKIHEIHPSVTSYSPASSTLNVKSSDNSIICSPVEDQSTSGNKRKYDNGETDGGSEELGLSPKKKRKKSDFNDGDGCKRCNCKKSRCLKLYCDCFAAGIYCAGPCACQECYNRPEYEDTVLETRRHIESRNPLAFAPRVVQPITEASASSCEESGTHFTPSSARHKRGCNCKKSMCLKKYCECYQSKVGCSDGCRCEGCKNVYGQKGDYGLGSESAHARIEGSLIEKAVVSGEALCNNEVSDPHNSTPLTPVVQSFIHGKDGSESCSLSGKNFQSPESDLTFVAQYLISPGSPRNPDNAQETMDPVPSDQHLYYGSSESMDEIPMVSISKAQPVSGSKNHSSLSSLQWQGAPNTPIVQARGANPHKLDDITRDDTPDILRDNPTPITAVKSSSPNKKRVSPPHAWQKQLTSSSTNGMKTGRKFILKAVPSFPPLTPCAYSKSNGSQQINDPHNNAHK